MPLALAGPAAQADGLTISTGGTANYEKSVAVPPGIAGMVPNLALQYAGGGRGVLGSGWSVRGASSITRCAASRPIDGVDGSITFTTDDKLCLDGQRLIQTDANGVPVNGAVSNPGPANPFQTNDSLGGTDMVREYRTEKDSFARIRAYGALNGAPANGPAYFKVWTKSGQVHEYGVLSNTASNAAVAAHGKSVGVVWAVSRISDRLGNYIDFNYEQREVAWGSGLKDGAPGAGPAPGREWVLKEILYTGNGTQAPANKVSFDYADAPAIDGVIVDGSEAYHLGSKVVALRRLESISTYVNGAKPVRVMRYAFEYDNSGFSRRSRLAKITECAGPTDGKCLPPVTFGYAPGGGTAYQRNVRFAETMATAELQGQEVGIVTGNFTGSGRTDILRWANDPANNRLYRSLGDGGFEQLPAGSAPGQFNLTDQQLSKADGCYVATAADFNGDGVTDILRTMASGADRSSCGTPRTLLFLSNGDGTFQTREVTGIDFARVMAKVEDHYACTDGTMDCESVGYVGTSGTEGKNYALLDLNRDGRMDVVTSVYPGFDQTSVLPTDAELCAGRICTRAFLGQGDGTFVEKTDTNVAQRSLYGDPGTRRLGARMPLVSSDLNGDGNTDLMGTSGIWLSRGDGNFDNAGDESATFRCNFVLNDFNGDGRPDCLYPHFMPALNAVTFSNGNMTMVPSTNFNLTKPGDELSTPAVAGKPETLGVDVADFDGDGRADILRWSDDPARNTLYLSNGDGSFRVAPFNLNNATDLLRKSDGKLGYLLGDFTGNGEVEILRLSSDHENDQARSNALFVKADHTPADQLLWVRTGTGMKTDLTWVPLTNSSSGAIGARYFTDAGGPAKSSYPVQDLLLPLYVVATVTADTGDGKSRLATEYIYAGLRAAHDGRGWLGFREMRRQSETPDGKQMTVLTAFVQDSFNTGVTQLTRTWLGAIRAVDPIVLSNTFNIYCDRTANPDVIAAASTVQSCPTTARLRKPYLHTSRADGWDIDGVPLPTVYTVNTFNDSGDPTRIAVSTQGNAVGMAQNFTKTTDNEYYPDDTAGDNWLVGRLKKAIVTGDNRVTPSAQALAARATAARSLAAVAAVADVAKVDVITVRDIAAKFGTAAGWSRDSGAAITNSPGSAPYAKAITGQVVTVDMTGTKKVYGTKAGTLSTLLKASITGSMAAPLQYSWTRVSGDRFTVSKNNLGEAAISGTLAVGENITERWSLTVTDAKGVSVSDSTYITLAVSAGPLVVTVTPNPLLVNAPDPGRVAGSVQVQVSGGIKPYTYYWEGDISGQRLDIDDKTSRTPTFSKQVAAGEAWVEQWRLYVDDADTSVAGAIAQVKVTLAAAATLTATTTANRTASVDATGVASTPLTLTVAGGRAPYTYKWERVDGARSTVSAADIANPVFSISLKLGETVTESWRATVADAAGHTATATTVVKATYTPPALALAFTPTAPRTDAPDPGQVGATVTGVPTGGLPPYTYAWTRYSGSLTAISDATSAAPTIGATLTAGQSVAETWRLTVTDSAAKTIAGNVTVTLTAPAALGAALPATKSITASASTGGVAATALAVTPSGGRAPYAYKWERTAGSRSTISADSVANPTVSFALNVGETLTENWTLTVTDAVGHTVASTIAITATYPAPALGLTFTPTAPRIDAPDPGLATVEVTGKPTGGVPPYTYAWALYSGTGTTVADPAAATAKIGATLTAGQALSNTWRLTVTDAAGKTVSGTVPVTLTAPAALKATLAATAAITASAGTGGVAKATLTPTVSGGRTPYTYRWQRAIGTRSTVADPAVATGAISFALSVGEVLTENWTVTVTDAVGHTADATIAIAATYPAPALGLTFTPASPRVDAPDPGPASVAVTANPTGGIPPYSYAWTRVTGTKTSISATTVANPVFGATLAASESVNESWKLTVTDSAGKTISGNVGVVMTAPAPLVVALNATTTAGIATASNGGVSSIGFGVAPTGGRAPYTYAWSRVNGTRSDATSTTVSNPTIKATLSLGETLTERWRVVVSDGVGHTATAQTDISFAYPAPPLAIAFAPTSVSVAANDPGIASGTTAATVTGGVPPYRYSWARTTGTVTSIDNPAAAAPVFSASLAGGQTISEQWTLTVTDSANKTLSKAIGTSFSALMPLTAKAAASSTSVNVTSGAGTGTASLTATASGGKAPYTYSWGRTAGGTSTVSNAAIYNPVLTAVLAEGQTVDETWQVTAKDAVGHASNASVTVRFTYPFLPLTVRTSLVNDRLTIASPGLASTGIHVDVTNGLAPYTYKWRRGTGTLSSIVSGGGADVVVGVNFDKPGRASEEWFVDVTDARGSTSSALSRPTFMHTGLELSCVNGGPSFPGNFSCNVSNWTAKAMPSIVMVPSDISQVAGWSPNSLENCAAYSYCGHISFNLKGGGRRVGTLKAAGTEVSNILSYDVTVN